MKPKTINWQEQAKKSAAIEAVKQVKNGFVVGLGSGSTVAYAIQELGRRIKQEKLELLAVPSSYQAFYLANQNRVPITTLDEYPTLDLTIDGADQVEKKTLNMIKGMGGALTREKIVAEASKKLVIIVDETKLTEKLGLNQPVPVEVIPFALALARMRLQKLHGAPEMREGKGKVGPVVTDNGNFILDVHFGKIEDAEKLNMQIKLIPGVVENGLFLNMADIVYVGTRGVVQRLVRQ
ncbi:MAG: ribose-5-phosphate isomerase RpiA [Candidatus Bathyarchaeia archaeon]|nr:ribose-5-phosphate isomerase RpiA [Candidatus Bathyarchaeota archaeon A05DMB-4]MDH7596035.1 ribose-5-phosphate isomerase RpiA [Candidatus Bathyarchaeota archaeon]